MSSGHQVPPNGAPSDQFRSICAKPSAKPLAAEISENPRLKAAFRSCFARRQIFPAVPKRSPPHTPSPLGGAGYAAHPPCRRSLVSETDWPERRQFERRPAITNWFAVPVRADLCP